MSRIYKDGHHPSELTMESINSLVDIIETYLCNYKLAVHMVYHKRRLIRLDIYRLGSKSLIASYSIEFRTLSLFHRKKFQGSISIDQIIEENKNRGYDYEF